MKSFVFTLLISFTFNFGFSQVFDVDTIQFNGSTETLINIVILGDGYTQNQLDQFVVDAQEGSEALFNEVPYSNYQNYFNIFLIKVPSNESGAANDPNNLIDNYYGSTYNAYGIQRLLVPMRVNKVTNVLASNFPLYDQVMMIVNDKRYGGSGGWISTSSMHADAFELTLHELGHSFADLRDEYWAGAQYAREGINMTQETNVELLKWENWYGDQGVDLYPHSESPTWYRPHQNCKMRYLGSAICAVCKEGIIERIHSLVSPLVSYDPTSKGLNLSDSDYPISFKLNLINPEPNTLQIKWTLNNSLFELNIDSIRIDSNELLSGSNSLSVTIEDTTELLRVDEHNQIHMSIVTWNIEKSNTCPQHFHPVWEGTLAQDHMNINVFGAELDGLDLALGDEIGVFDGNTCVGFGKLTKTIDQQNVLSIKVSKNDGSGNGYTEGHEVSYIIWDCATNAEFEVTGVQCFNNQLTPISCLPFEAGVTSYVKLSAVRTICQTVKLRTGWNILSIPNQPEPADMETIFDALIETNSLIKIQDEGGNSLEDWGIFGSWTNNIGQINPTEGYKIKVGFTDSMYICGSPVVYPFAISLQTGWNIMGYPQTIAFDGMNGIVKQLIDRGTLIKVQDEAGNSIEDWGIFGGWTNNIGDFKPGEGYKIKVNANDTLLIFDSYPKSTTILPKQAATTHFKPEYEGNGVEHMNINLIGLPINVLKTGDELAIFDGTTCVGAVTIMPHHLQSKTVSIAASANDNEGMAGFREGNLITLKMWNSKNNQEFKLEPEIVKGTSTFTKHETTVASLEKYSSTGLEGLTGANYPEIKVYPNPFSDEVTIEINLSVDTEVEVEVLNQLGQQVKFISSKQILTRGLHMLSWDGTNANGSKVVSGTYLLKVNDRIEKVVVK